MPDFIIINFEIALEKQAIKEILENFIWLTYILLGFRLLWAWRYRTGPLQEHSGPGRNDLARRTYRADLVLLEVRTVDRKAFGLAAEGEESAIAKHGSCQ